jgi:peptidoglycan/LPS O-acetylase OafA/YrhL
VTKLQTYRPEIDGLRAVAVISVLLYHVGVLQFSGGYVGVDVFFVISGFLITRIIFEEASRTGTFSFSNFYLRRLRRLFPALLTTVAISFLFGYWLLSPLNFREFGGSAITALTSVSNFFFWAHSGYFDTAAISKPLLHTWSLSVEEQFYLVWPAFIATLTLKKWPVPVVLLAAGAASLLFNIPFSSGDTSTIFYLTPFRVFEFVIGAILIWLPQISRYRINQALTLGGLLLIAFSVLTYTQKTIFPSFHALPPCIGAACVIYAGNNPIAKLLLGNRLSVFIGKISYSLYLVHWPLIVFYRYYVFDPPRSNAANRIDRCCCCARNPTALRNRTSLSLAAHQGQEPQIRCFMRHRGFGADRPVRQRLVEQRMAVAVSSRSR